MALTIEAGSGTRLKRSPTGFVVRVDVAADVVTAASASLERTRGRLLGLDDPDSGLGLDPRTDRNDVAYVSPVIPTPVGAVLYVDGGHVSPRRLVQVLDWAVEDLHHQGVTDAVVSVPRPSEALEQIWYQDAGPRLTLTHVAPVALHPAPVPTGWEDAAMRWLVGDPKLIAEKTTALIISQEFAIGPGAVTSVLALDRPAWHAPRTVLVGTPSTGVRFARYDNLVGSYVLTLGSCGTAVPEVDGGADQLAMIAEGLATHLSYAFLELPVGSPLDREDAPPGRPPRLNHMDVIDEAALDAFPFQVLGPGHLRRLGHLPEARPLAGGRVSWRMGSIDEWRDDRRATELRALGRTMLAPVLLDDDPLFELGKARMHAQHAEMQRLQQES